MSADPLHPVEAVVVLTHDVPLNGRDAPPRHPKPCGQVATRVTVTYLQRIADGRADLVCDGCRKRLGLDDVSGDEPYVPSYIPPAGGV